MLGDGGTHRFAIGVFCMIETDIKTELFHCKRAFFCAARNTDGAQTVRLGNLTHHRADRAGGRGHNKGFTGLGAAQFHQPVPAGKPWHSQHP